MYAGSGLSPGLGEQLVILHILAGKRAVQSPAPRQAQHLVQQYMQDSIGPDASRCSPGENIRDRPDHELQAAATLAANTTKLTAITATCVRPATLRLAPNLSATAGPGVGESVHAGPQSRCSPVNSQCSSQPGRPGHQSGGEPMNNSATTPFHH